MSSLQFTIMSNMHKKVAVLPFPPWLELKFTCNNVKKNNQTNSQKSLTNECGSICVFLRSISELKPQMRPPENRGDDSDPSQIAAHNRSPRSSPAPARSQPPAKKKKGKKRKKSSNSNLIQIRIRIKHKICKIKYYLEQVGLAGKSLVVRPAQFYAFLSLQHCDKNIFQLLRLCVAQSGGSEIVLRHPARRQTHFSGGLHLATRRHAPVAGEKKLEKKGKMRNNQLCFLKNEIFEFKYDSQIRNKLESRDKN